MTPAAPLRLSGEDLTFWWADSPMQPTTMAMLLVLDRRPDQDRLRNAFERAVAAVPRLRQHVVEAPLDLTLPHWASDPTFDIDYHLRHHAVTATCDLDELFREIAPAYETPFDRSRPLWEARLFDGLPDGKAALFFKLHHAVADGVGANAIFAALTDGEREPAAPAAADPLPHGKGTWDEEPPLVRRVADALRDRVDLGVARAKAAAHMMTDTALHPSRIPQALRALRSLAESLQHGGNMPLTSFGRTRCLAGLALPFADVRRIKHALGGTVIDVILTVMARAMGKWHLAHGRTGVTELNTLVPVNLRTADQWVDQAHVGNVATGLLVPLPITLDDPLVMFAAVRRCVAEKKVDPAAGATPILADLLGVLGRQFVSWMAEVTFGVVDFIVTNVPGILATRYLAGAEILAAYPFAPVAQRSPASVAIYGYRDQLFVGLDADLAAMPDVDAFKEMIREAFRELAAAAGVPLGSFG
jgi:WS/DGAT/MGAT family acyltransferase